MLTFYGNFKIRVLGGVVDMESFALKPSESYLSLCIRHTAMSLRAIDPHEMVSGLHASVIIIISSPTLDTMKKTSE